MILAADTRRVPVVLPVRFFPGREERRKLGCRTGSSFPSDPRSYFPRNERSASRRGQNLDVSPFAEKAALFRLPFGRGGVKPRRHLGRALAWKS